MATTNCRISTLSSLPRFDMPISPRPLESYLEAFFSALTLNNSPLNDRAPGSALYTLGRGLATVCADQDLRLLAAAEGSHLARAERDDLDRLCRDLLLTRRPALPAVGSVLAIASAAPTVIEPATVLTDPLSEVQLLTRNEGPVVVGLVSETRVPVIAARPGLRGNLSAGTRLIDPLHPTVAWAIGTNRDGSSRPRGDLLGGQEVETDASLRQRAQMSLLGRKGGTNESIRAQVLSHTGIDSVELQVLAPGVVTVWVDAPAALSTDSRERIERTLSLHRPLGVVTLLRQLQRQLTALDIFLVPGRGQDLGLLRQAALDQAGAFVRALGRGRPLDPQVLQEFLADALTAREVRITTPATVVACPDNAVIRLTDTRVTFP